MNRAETVAYINAQAIACQCELTAMTAGNLLCMQEGKDPIHEPEAFQDLIPKYSLHHNALLTLFQQATE